jgi:anti-sigma factor RsiW
MKPFLTCRELIDFLGEYFEGGLAPAQRDEFERHLAVCPSCLVYLETYKSTIVLSRAAFADEECEPDAPQTLPAEVPEALIAAILAARKKS